MHADLEHLVSLDRLDRAIEQTEKKTQAAKDALTERTAALEAAKRHADDLQKQLAESRDAQHAAERQAKRYRDRKKSAQNVLETGSGDYEAATRQVAECDRILDDLETTILVQLELQDELVSTMNAAEAAIVAAREALAQQHEATPATVAEQAALKAELQTERTTHEQALPHDLLDRYARVCARKKRAVAPVRHDACGACMQTIKAQERIELKRERLVECGSCHRWLYLEEQLTDSE